MLMRDQQMLVMDGWRLMDGGAGWMLMMMDGCRVLHIFRNYMTSIRHYFIIRRHVCFYSGISSHIVINYQLCTIRFMIIRISESLRISAVRTARPIL